VTEIAERQAPAQYLRTTALVSASAFPADRCLLSGWKRLICFFSPAGSAFFTVLSRITDRRAGKLDWEFYLRAATFVALPLLAVLASHFRSVGQYVSSWIQPVFKLFIDRL